MSRITLACCLLTCFQLAPLAHGDGPPAGPEVVKITLHPQAAPRPALKYPLLHGVMEQVSGNAALGYERAFLILAEAKQDPKEAEQADAWRKLPPGELPRDEVRKYLARFGGALNEIEMAARRDSCDWQLPIHEQKNPIMILLPDVQRARDAVRLLALRARLEIADKNYPQAVLTLRRGYSLARHCNEQHVFISSLVGIACQSMMDEQLLTLIQQPDAPNLYWSLTNLPSPLVDVRAGIPFEAAIVRLMFRDLGEIDGPPLQQAVADDKFARFTKELGVISETLDQNDSSPFKKILLKFAGAAYVEFAYPAALARLVERGRKADALAKYPHSQLLLIDFFETFDDFRDELFKWLSLPYPEAKTGLDQAEAFLKQTRDKAGLGGTIAGLLLPATRSIASAGARSQRRLETIRILEAIRLYAAGHDGKLPARLDEITEAPIPRNTVTGKPFEYRLDGDHAILEENGLGPLQDRRYEITLAK